MIGLNVVRRRRRMRWVLYAVAILGGLWFSVTTLRTPDAEVAMPGGDAPLSRGLQIWIPPWQADRLPRPPRSAWFGVADGLLTIGAIWPFLRLAR